VCIYSFLWFLYTDPALPRPADHKELFNLHHASAQNVIERAFGVLKKRFRILLIPPAYNMNVQVRVPVALCCIHNFILAHDRDEGELPGDDNIPDTSDPGGEDIQPQVPADGDGGAHGVEARRDLIARAMWEQYRQIHRERGLLNLDD
jgi:Plant transposon protein